MGPNMRNQKNFKKRKVAVEPKVEEISFDSENRQEWLTGFHKRKVQRAKHAADLAAKQYKEDRRTTRAKVREERKKDFETAMEEHAAVLRRLKEDAGDIMEEEEEEEGDWNGFEEPPAVDYEAEYIDEDKYTTVTVEEMDASREGLLKSAQEYDTDNEEEKPKPVETKEETKTEKKRRPRSAASEAARKKKRNFRYESKDVRRETQRKQRNIKSKKAKARKDKDA